VADHDYNLLKFNVSNIKNLLMKRTLLPMFLLALITVDCVNDDLPSQPKHSCSVRATVKDFRGKLDGCGFLFKLDDGTLLEPLIYWCGTPPISEEQKNYPLNNFEFIDGKVVYINYEIIPDMFSVCMTGPIVKITCLDEGRSTSSEE
jgi:hypothetical protein